MPTALALPFLLLAMATFALSEALMGVIKPVSDEDRQREMDAQRNIGSMALTLLQQGNPDCEVMNDGFYDVKDAVSCQVGAALGATPCE